MTDSRSRSSWQWPMKHSKEASLERSYTPSNTPANGGAARPSVDVLILKYEYANRTLSVGSESCAKCPRCRTNLGNLERPLPAWHPAWPLLIKRIQRLARAFIVR